MLGTEFVYAVCGSEDHIQTLNLSLRLLRRFSNFPITVVTDIRRNRAKVEHDNIVDVRTPTEYTDKQAAIFLKTGLFNFLPQGKLYCYLDSDVLAVREGVDDIFGHFHGPVTFCTDISKLQSFAPYAVRSGNSALPSQDEIGEIERRYIDLQGSKLGNSKDQRRIREIFFDFEQEFVTASERSRTEFLRAKRKFFEACRPPEQTRVDELTAKSIKFYLMLAHLKALTKVHYTGRYGSLMQAAVKVSASALHAVLSPIFSTVFRRRDGEWRTRNGVVLRESEVMFSKLFCEGYTLNPFTGIWFDKDEKRLNSSGKELAAYAAQFGLRYDYKSGRWYSARGELLLEDKPAKAQLLDKYGYEWDPGKEEWRQSGVIDGAGEVPLLEELIFESFGVSITEPNWQHWNGGVFLFDSSASRFLQTWHEWSIQIFGDSRWSVRDQGTLIAAAWKFGLQTHATLPVEYNFLADYYSPQLRYRGELAFNIYPEPRVIKPKFLHIYHHFGDTSWELWQDIDELCSRPRCRTLPNPAQQFGKGPSAIGPR